MNETTTVSVDPSAFFIPAIINLIILALLVSIPIMIARWFLRKERERKEQMNRIEAKIDQLEKTKLS